MQLRLVKILLATIEDVYFQTPGSNEFLKKPYEFLKKPYE